MFNIKRAILFGAMLWVAIFLVLSILMFVPALADKRLIQHIIFWVLLAPITLLLAKWYFKMDPPSIKKGILLGIVGLMVMTVLDVIITVPLFVKSYSVFFIDWIMYVGYAEVLLFCLLAGGEFDGTFTKREGDKQ